MVDTVFCVDVGDVFDVVDDVGAPSLSWRCDAEGIEGAAVDTSGIWLGVGTFDFDADGIGLVSAVADTFGAEALDVDAGDVNGAAVETNGI